MNFKILFMQFTSYLKRFAPVLGVLVVLVAVFNFGSYDPYNELSTISPDAVMAASGFILTDSKSGAACGSDCGAIVTCNVQSNINTVAPGGSVTISWQTQGVSSVTLNGEAVGNSGSQTFTNIQNNTTYTLLATSVDGSVNCRSTVTVLCVAPPVVPVCVSFTAVPDRINAGEQSTLTWNTTGGTVTITSISGQQNPSGSLIVTPQGTITYILRVAGVNGQSDECRVTIYVTPAPVDPTPTPAPICVSFTASPTVVAPNGAPLLVWVTQNATGVTISGISGTLPANSSRLITGITQTTTYTLTVIGTNGQTVNCSVTVTVTPVTPLAPICDSFTASPLSGAPGSQRTLTWATTNATGVAINGIGNNLALDGSATVNPTVTTIYTLLAVGANNQTASCAVTVTVTPVTPLAPICDSFTATPLSGAPGSQRTLTWATTNATGVAINGVGNNLALDGSATVNPTVTTIYTLLAVGANNQTASCAVTVTVIPNPLAPVCLTFTASPASIVRGGTSTLAWTTQNAQTVSINNGVGTVAVNSSTQVSPLQTTIYTLTVFGENNQTASCLVTVTVTTVTPGPITCQNNVTFNASPTSIREGDSSTLSWNTTGVTSLRFDNGITATGLSGSVSVEPRNSTTYNLIATTGNTTVSCPVSISVSTGGGGGGGSPSPRCELSISKNKINRGDSVTLRWDTSNARELKLEDKTARKVLLDTDDMLSRDKDKFFDDSLTVRPTKDTTYLLTVERGSKTRTCTVSVDVVDNIVVNQIRDQQPLVSGIALTAVPYTGFAAGPILTVLFYMLLMAWALYIAYILVIRRDEIGGLKLATQNANHSATILTDRVDSASFVASTAEASAPVTPINLPTAVVGYASFNQAEEETIDEAPVHSINETEMTQIENKAHAARVLLSSDAIRYFISSTNSVEERDAVLVSVMKEAKEKYPAEDGWVVLNEKRMQDLCLVCVANVEAKSSTDAFTPVNVPAGSGSLAEAIVSGNVVSAYEMIGHRPMFALADAASDLDAVYRIRNGGEGVASELLMKETAKLSNEQILTVIQALTGALDGVYTDEASAVKMAIMKAVKMSN